MVTHLTRTVALTLIIAFNFVSISTADEPAKLVFRETALDALGPVPVAGRSVKINEAGTLAACLIERDGKMCISINGQEGPAFDWISLQDLGLEKQSVVYTGNRGGVWPPFQQRGELKGGQWFKVIDDQEPVPIDADTCAGYKYIPQDMDKAVSADGKKVAVIARPNNNDSSLRINGRAEKHYNSYLFPVLSSNGERLAYEASINHSDIYQPSSFVVVDGKRGPFYNCIGRYNITNWMEGYMNGSTISFSPDSNHVAYTAYQYKDRDDDRVDHVVLDGQDEVRQKRQYYETPDPVFSADSQWLAYGESKNYRTCSLVMRRVEGNIRYQSREYDTVWLPRSQSTGIIHFFALRDQKIFRVKIVAADQTGE